ncbi:MAG: hypothetical protein IPK13_02975 [Deltaproteobacteria bacterium]|nr:hypothetical protein [Deltaproteobacteria bacterium]
MFQINAAESTNKVDVTPVVSVECFGVSTHARCGHDEERVQYLISDVVHSMFVQQTSLTFREQTGLVGGSRGKLLAMTGIERTPGSASSTSASVAGSGSSGRVLAQLAERVGMLTPRFLRESTTEDLEEAVQTALHAAATGPRDDDAEQQTMLSAAYVLWPELHVMSFGHGSVYLLRGGVLGRLTGGEKGERLAAAAWDRGAARASNDVRGDKGKGCGAGVGADASDHGRSLREVPVPGSLFNRDHHRVQSHPEIRREHLKADDAIVLCSHTLNRTLDEARIASIVRNSVSPEAACRGLVEAAKVAGCSDPITVLVAHCRPS